MWVVKESDTGWVNAQVVFGPFDKEADANKFAAKRNDAETDGYSYNVVSLSAIPADGE